MYVIIKWFVCKLIRLFKSLLTGTVCMLFASFYAPLRYIWFNIWNFVVFPELMNKYNYTLQLKNILHMNT